jgi:hypothetical protein
MLEVFIFHSWQFHTRKNNYISNFVWFVDIIIISIIIIFIRVITNSLFYLATLITAMELAVKVTEHKV